MDKVRLFDRALSHFKRRGANRRETEKKKVTVIQLNVQYLILIIQEAQPLVIPPATDIMK